MAYIVDCVRTAGGKKNGALSKYHPADLGALVVDELVRRNGIDGNLIDDVIFGCLTKIGAQSANVARSVVLSSETLPIEVPGTTIDRQGGSGQQAIHFAAQAVLSGTQDCVIAGGVEVMSLIPIGSDALDGIALGRGRPYSEKTLNNFNVKGFNQFKGAQLLAQKYSLTREDLDKFSERSHHAAYKATMEGKFKNQILPIPYIDKEGKECLLTQDEGIRPTTTYNALSNLKPLTPEGILTAGNSSQITDGASAILICNENGLKKLGLKPRAKIIQMAVVGDDPVIMLHGPIPSTKKVLLNSGLTLDDISLYEINEAFASVPLAWLKALGGDINKLNVNGGAISLGHPIGSTGIQLTCTLLNELEKRGEKYGLQAICQGGGAGIAMIIENISSNRKSSL